MELIPETNGNVADGGRTMSNLPCMRDRCIGKECCNFNDPESKWFNAKLKPGCKGGEFPPWSYARIYIKRNGG